MVAAVNWIIMITITFVLSMKSCYGQDVPGLSMIPCNCMEGKRTP